MIDAIAKALMLWAVPYNDWHAISEEQRERWRAGARAAADAIAKHESRLAVSRSTLTLAGYQFLSGDDYDGPYYRATITREHEGTGYAIAFGRKTTPTDG